MVKYSEPTLLYVVYFSLFFFDRNIKTGFKKNLFKRSVVNMSSKKMSDSQKEQSLFSTSVTLHKSLKNHTEREIQCYPIQCLQTSCVVGFCVYALKSVQPTRTPNYCQTETRTKLTRKIILQTIVFCSCSANNIRH